MSLINDALKRAKQVQHHVPESQHLPFRPVEPSPYRRHGLGLVVPAALGVIALLVLLLAWQKWRINSAEVRAREIEPAPIVEPAKPTPEPVKAADPAPQPVVAPSTLTNTASSNMLASIAVPEPEKPAPLKLQGVIFNPKRPSAVISGRTIFIGDRVRDYKVVAINRDSATLVNGEEKLVLNLAQ